jgi:hypothetical protein
MSFDDYTVTIYWTTEGGNASQSTFDVMAYSEEEAANIAFAQWSDLGYNHVGVLDYEIELTEEVEW